MAAKSHGLTEMVEFLEQEMMDSSEYDHKAVIAEAEKFVTRGKTLLPLRPLSMTNKTIS